MSGGARRTARFGLTVGQTVGSYRILDELGGGGMGMVYTAEHVLIGRRAAVKVLRAEYSHMPEVVERFFNEARATTSIRHPGIVEVFDFGYTDDGHAFIVMELLDGVSLADHVTRARRLPAADAVVIARRIAAALAAAHARGVVHRDLKPDNVFLVADPEGGPVPQLKLLDFGIAKLGDEVSRTLTGVVLGTPLYMSPEQCRGAASCDHRSDLYSLGCVMFEMITGRPPFLGNAAGEVIAGHLMTVPPDLRGLGLDVPAPVATLVARLLEKDPIDRGESATVVVAALDRIIEEQGGIRRSAVQPTVVARSSPRVGVVTPAPVSLPLPISMPVSLPFPRTPQPFPLPAARPADPRPSHVVIVPRPTRRLLSGALIVTGAALAAVAAALVRTGMRTAGSVPAPDGGAFAAGAASAQRPASTPDARAAIEAVDADATTPTLTSVRANAAVDAGVPVARDAGTSAVPARTVVKKPRVRVEYVPDVPNPAIVPD